MTDPKMNSVGEILKVLRSMESPENREGMGRFGINVERALGIKVTDLRKLARRIEKSHDLAEELWRTGIHEARILATMVDEPARVTEIQMENWASDFDSWDMVDQCCNNLLRRTPLAHEKAVQWSSREEEFVKRAGFALMAVLAVHDRESTNEVFAAYLDTIERAAEDDRNFVRKSVNWALRQIGKRNSSLREKAVETALRIREQGTRSAKWIAGDALRELERFRRQKTGGKRRKRGTGESVKRGKIFESLTTENTER